jgi:hypothetical protein
MFDANASSTVTLSTSLSLPRLRLLEPSAQSDLHSQATPTTPGIKGTVIDAW